MTDHVPRDVDEYIEAAPEAAQPMLHELRRLIRSAAPDAEEKISYRMPFYEYHGRLVYFAAYKNHIGLYPLGRAKDMYADELKEYLSGRSTARFPIGRPLPVSLIRKVVRLRVEENEAKPLPKARS